MEPNEEIQYLSKMLYASRVKDKGRIKSICRRLKELTQSWRES